MNKKCTALIWLILILPVLTGCEALLAPLKKDTTEEAALEKYKDVPLREALNQTQREFAKAKEQALYFYSPGNYRTAQSGLKIARAYFRDPDKRIQVLKSLYKTDAALKEGFEVKEIVDREMSEVVALRVSLAQLKAKTTHPREYRGLAVATSSLIEQVEKNKEKLFADPSSKARFEEDKKELIVSLQDFRLRVVKDRYLRKGEDLVAGAESYGAKKIAPITYAATIKSMNEAVTYIENNVENQEGIQTASDRFEFSAQRLMNIVREINLIISLKETTYEEYVLRQETRLVVIADALNAGDMRNKNFSTQTSKLATAANTVVKQKQEYALAIAEGASSNTLVAVPPQTASEIPNQPSQQVKQDGGPDPLVAGVAGGDLETLKGSVRLLTDQIYQLTLENSELKGQRDLLKTKVEQLEAKVNKKSSAKEKITPTQ